MVRSLYNESNDVITAITEFILRCNDPTRLLELLLQLRASKISFDETGTIAFFNGFLMAKFEPSKSFDVETKFMDLDGNPLHGILYMDEAGDLLALEVFSWQHWTKPIDVHSLTVAKYSN